MQPGNLDEDDSDFSALEASSLEVAEEKDPLAPPEPAPRKRKRRKFTPPKKKDLVMWGLPFAIVIAIVIAAFLLLRKPETKAPTTYVINTQSLDNGTLNELTAGVDGEVRQQLTISPDTIFKNDVNVQGSLQVDRDLLVGGRTTLQGAVTAADSLTVQRSLTVSGNTSIASNLTVNGQISAASLTVGSLTISSINLSSNLVFAGHIVPGGLTPSARASVAASGGSVNISGNDTAGTVTISVGNGSTVAGEMAIITFRTAFSTTPKVQLTPINPAASGLRYYATRNASLFTVDTSTAPSAGTTYVFDYLVTQ